MMPRQKLPERRRNVTQRITWPPGQSKTIHITAGFDTHDKVREVFVRGGGVVGSERDALLDDIAVVVSRLLQYGDSLKDIAHGLSGRQGTMPASLVGAIVDTLIEIEQSGPMQEG